MSLSVKPPTYKIPEYSLTGDLLSFLTCGLQYRYHNRGALPPSTPVQLWFGEFIHGVMEEAYLQYKTNPQLQRFPWSWQNDVRDIEIQIFKRLKARGMSPPPRLFCPYDSSFTSQGLCPDVNHPHQRIASKRTELAINTWGKDLFALIDEAEVRLKGIRPMPNFQQGVSRCNYYGITGRIDVLSSVAMANAPAGNLIITYLQQNPEVQRIMDNITEEEYEIIIDYKGMRRPPQLDPNPNNAGNLNPPWERHEWQILTYAGLRYQQQADRPIAAGIIFYFNELAPADRDMKSLQDEVNGNLTDVGPSGQDLRTIQNWRSRDPIPTLSTSLREQRSIRIIPIVDRQIQNSNQNFDKVVLDIETSVLNEIGGQTINQSWHPTPVERTCTACDFKTFCPNPAPKRYTPTVP